MQTFEISFTARITAHARAITETFEAEGWGEAAKKAETIMAQWDVVESRGNELRVVASK